MGNLLKFIGKNWIWSIFGSILLAIFCLVMVFSILWGDAHDFDQLLEVSQDDIVNCINGEFCPFCSITCICEFGWKGENCDQKVYNNETFYPMNWWDLASMESITQGSLSENDCMIGCVNDEDCKGYVWNLCETEVPSCCLEPEWPCIFLEPPPPECCYGFGPNPSCCTSQCKHITNLNGFAKPAFVTMYERSEGLSQRTLYIKNAARCFGYLCTYNEEYGLVWTDDFTHSLSIETIDEIVHDGIPTWNGNGDWQDTIPETMGNYSTLSPKLGDVLEITELPFLQMRKIFDTATSEINSMTVACSRSIMYSMMASTDYYSWTYDGKSLIKIQKDYSLQFLESGEIPKKYDTIILTMPMYMRKSLPRLFTNAFNMLKDGGTVIIRAQFWPFVNSTVITNYCMAAGMVKWKFANEFGSLFTQMHLELGNTVSEPCNVSCDNPEPIPFKTTECWGWVSGFYHPGHIGQWYSFIGKK